MTMLFNDAHTSLNTLTSPCTHPHSDMVATSSAQPAPTKLNAAVKASPIPVPIHANPSTIKVNPLTSAPIP